MMDDMNKLSEQLTQEYNSGIQLPVDSVEEEEANSATSLFSAEVSGNTKGVKTISLFNADDSPSNAVGLDYRSVMHELVKPIQRAVIGAGSSSIAKETLGDFLNAFPVDGSWKREELFDTGKHFYVLKNQSREAHIYNLLHRACKIAEGDVITIPAVSPLTLSIDEPGIQFELNTYSLSFTRKELQYIKFAFIRHIKFQYNEESSDPFLDARYVIEIDKTKLRLAPFTNNCEG